MQRVEMSITRDQSFAPDKEPEDATPPFSIMEIR